ncbi:MAG: hypothetical protein ACK2UO_11185 [Caldilineaceae bacterium]
MRRYLFCIIVCGAVSIVAALTAGVRPALAQAVNCTASRNNAPVLSAPAILAPVRGNLDNGDPFVASAQANGFGGPWLSVESNFAEGWIRSAFVSGCSFAALPLRQSPAQRPALAGLVPPADQTGPSQPAIFLAADVKTGVDGLHVFTQQLDLLIDPSIKAFELGTDVMTVTMSISDEDGNPLYSIVDTSDPFCLFASLTAECENVWTFAQTGYFWPIPNTNPVAPSNQRIDANERYSLGLDVQYSDGGSDFWNWSFRIRPANTPPEDLYHVVDATSGSAGSMPFDATEVRIRLDTLKSADFTPVFADRMVMELAQTPVLTPADPQIGSVQFVIRDGPGGEAVFAHTERQTPYCLFGNTQTTHCDAIWRFADTGNIWPRSDDGSGVTGTHALLPNHTYEATVSVTDTDGNAGNRWTFEFEIAGVAEPPPVNSGIVAKVLQYGPGSTVNTVSQALAFQLAAHDPAVGASDGAGIAQVSFDLYAPDGSLVWQRSEGAEPYCLFSNASGASACNVWDFAQAGMHWPNGQAIQAGQYTIRATISGDGGRTETYTYDFTVQQTSQPQNPAPVESEIAAMLVQIGPGSLSATVSQALAFQIEAWDTAVGTTDGAGIAQVDFQLVGPTGTVVHQRTEGGAPYCLFSNSSGSDECNTWRFVNALNRWPSGQSIRTGQHTVVATVTADNGQTEVFTYDFTVGSGSN